jgi:hypothetical protein
MVRNGRIQRASPNGHRLGHRSRHASSATSTAAVPIHRGSCDEVETAESASAETIAATAGAESFPSREIGEPASSELRPDKVTSEV